MREMGDDPRVRWDLRCLEVLRLHQLIGLQNGRFSAARGVAGLESRMFQGRVCWVPLLAQRTGRPAGLLEVFIWCGGDRELDLVGNRIQDRE